MARFNETEEKVEQHSWSLAKDIFDERFYLIEKMFKETLNDYVVEPWVVLDDIKISRDDESDNFEIFDVHLNLRFGSERVEGTQQSLELRVPGVEFCNYDFIKGMIYQQLENTDFGGFYCE